MGLPEHFLRTTYWASDYLKGSPVRKQYNDIRVIMEDQEKGGVRRNKHLNTLLKHATQHSLFYNKCNPEDLLAFPVVNKTILMANYWQVRVAKEEIPNQKGEIFVQKTSGSTGTPFAIPQDTRKRIRRVAELKYFGERVGFKSHDKLIQLRSWNRWQKKSKLQSIKENIIPFDISLINDQRLSELCDIIQKNNIVALRGYASSINLFAHYVADNGVNLSGLKLIISGSEALEDGTRELVKKYIGCKIISQYANEENGILAQEYVEDLEYSFYLNHASYFFEVLKLDQDRPVEYGELGRIVVTDFFNYAFPLIRYDTGDTGIIGMGNRHSNGYPVLKKLYGRRLDMVFDTKGDIVFPMAIARIMKHYSEVVQWQFIQTFSDRYLLRLALANKEFNYMKVKDDLIALFGQNANIEFEFTDEIPVLASGKRKPVINKWKV